MRPSPLEGGLVDFVGKAQAFLGLANIVHSYTSREGLRKKYLIYFICTVCTHLRSFLYTLSTKKEHNLYILDRKSVV